MSEKKYPVKKGKEYELTIERLAFGGQGVSRMDNYVIFVKRALPGDQVKVKIIKRKKDFAEAYVTELLEPSKYRVEPSCKYFDWCGGCTWQNMGYENQLYFKRQIVAESLERIGGFEKVTVLPVIPSDTFFSYRNKMEFSFSDRRWLLPEELNQPHIHRDFALGLHVPGTFDKILHVEKCLLQSETANQVLNFISDYAQNNHLSPYGIRSHQGFLRFLVIRESAFNHELMVNLVTASDEPERLKDLAKKLAAKFPHVVSIVNNVNSRLAQIAQGEKENLLYGQPYITDKIGPFLFNISANSFFQTNTKQAEKLYQKAIEFAELDQNAVVWDLYSGTGSISIFLAQKAKKVIGFEAVASAVKDAWQNAREHKVNNVEFVEGDLLQTMAKVSKRPEVIVTDPPRSGMHEKVVRLIKKIGPRTLVYVSCNPTTLARDLKILADKYRIEKVQPVDMFPQTYHIETVVQLKKKS
ncbi:MAG: 23S rRNA (uracil(1939)-C(5))-methyltransferase RlmD [Caldisericaceae bacterium]|nr:23S rRNA (uracil(1939)-C(5))-methyltransferase RlmD [Caldisericaceae bacterium]